MSQSASEHSENSPNINTRKKKQNRNKKTEETTIRQILKLQRELQTEHKTASLFTFTSKFGQLQFGSKNVVEKFRRDFGETDEWHNAFEEDDDEIIGGIQDDNIFGAIPNDLESCVDDYNHA